MDETQSSARWVSHARGADESLRLFLEAEGGRLSRGRWDYLRACNGRLHRVPGGEDQSGQLPAVHAEDVQQHHRG